MLRRRFLLLLTAAFLGLTLPSSDAKDPGETHDTYVFGQDEFASGSTALLRVAVLRAKSLLETLPVEGAEVHIEIRGKEFKGETLFDGKTDDRGLCCARLDIPDLPPGSYEVAVTTKSALGEQTLTRPVKLRKEARVLLVTDKPLYQPAQLIHMRALALHDYSLKPIADADVLFEVEDAKGNKVFKSHDVKSNAFGVAHADFQLADEIAMGTYKLIATLPTGKAEKSVEVKRYVLPKFKVQAATDKRFYLPREVIKGTVDVNYFFGKPVAGGKVKVKAATFDVEFRDFFEQTVDTDAAGHATFEVALPDSFVGQPLEKGDAFVKIEIAATDTADHTETVTRTANVSQNPIHVAVMPESGKLVPGVENLIWVVATYPDGTPAQADVAVTVTGKDAKNPSLRAAVETDEAGIASVAYTPKAEDFQPGEWIQERGVFGRGGRWAPDENYVQSMTVPVQLSAKDDQGNTAELTAQLSAETGNDNVLLRIDKAIYRSGSRVTMDVATTASVGTVYLDVTKDRQTVLTTMIPLEKGRARYELDLPQDLFGSVEIHAYKVMANGEIMRDTKVAYVEPSGDLAIKATPDKPEYRPGEDARIDFMVTDKEGSPVQAALGVIVVDESVYALQDMQPGLEKVYFTLAKELAEPKYGIKYGTAMPQLISGDEVDVRRQEVAQVLLAPVEPRTEYRWVVNPQYDRQVQVAEKIGTIHNAIQNFVNAGGKVADQAQDGAWRLSPDLLETVIRAGHMREEVLQDPWGQRMTLDVLSRYSGVFRFEHWQDMVDSTRIYRLWSLILQHAYRDDVVEKDASGAWQYRPTLVADMLEKKETTAEQLLDIRGEALTPEGMAGREKPFEAANVVKLVRTQRRQMIYNCLYQFAYGQTLAGVAYLDASTGRWAWKEGALDPVARAASLDRANLKDPFGGEFELNALAREDEAFSPENIGRYVLASRWYNVVASVYNYGNEHRDAILDKDRSCWVFPKDIVARLTHQNRLDGRDARDPWGNALVVKDLQKETSWIYCAEMRFTTVFSPGPDGKEGTADDIDNAGFSNYKYLTNAQDFVTYEPSYAWYEDGYADDTGMLGFLGADALAQSAASGASLRSRSGGKPGRAMKAMDSPEECDREVANDPAAPDGGGSAAPRPRIREYFPETLVWEPCLITDESGRATMPVTMADSITTWRLTASASAADGRLGSMTSGVRVFQDFFVDIDFPVALTQHDEVSVPVAVFNYLKEPQDVRLVAEKDPNDDWYTLLGDAEQTVSLGAGEVRAVYFRLRAERIGTKKMTVMAYGSKLSDAIRRAVEVVPDGKRFETVINDRMSKEVYQVVRIPENSIPESYKLIVKAYPGVFSQVVEGVDGLMGMPHG